MPRERAGLGASLLLAALAGCAGPPPIFPPVDPPIVWPREGDPARIAYAGMIEGEADLGSRRSVWSWIARLVTGSEPPAEIDRAHGVALTGSEVLWVTDPGARVVHRFDLDSRRYRSLADSGAGPFEAPIGIATLGDGVIVTDRILRTASVLSPEGDPAGVIGAGELEGPAGVAVGPVSGRIYVVDVPVHRIKVFEPTGALVLELGERGTGPGQFNFPTYVACDREEEIHVTDSLNSRIQVLDPAGRFLRSWGQRGDTPGDFSQPKGLACDSSGRVYAVDSHFENVQIFTPEGELLLAFGNEGTGPGEFWLPVGIFVDGEDRIWVGDSFNRRVQVFRPLAPPANAGREVAR